MQTTKQAIWQIQDNPQVNKLSPFKHEEILQHIINTKRKDSKENPTISKKILNIVGRTNAKYNLIKEGDRILLGLSGGKDSMLLATIFAYMKKHAPFKFEFLAMTIDYGRGGEYEYIFEYCKKLNIPYELNRTQIFKILENHRERRHNLLLFLFAYETR